MKRKQRRSKRRTRPGIASKYIQSLPDLALSDGDLKIVIYGRASTRQQQARKNLQNQVEVLQSEIAELVASLGESEAGCIPPRVNVIEVFSEVGTSDIAGVAEPSGTQGHRSQLKLAIECARKHNAILVADTRDRFLRYRGYDGNLETDQPTDSEFKEFVSALDGVIAATFEDPDLPSAEVRSKQIKRGQKFKSKGGRRRKSTSKENEKMPYKIRREALLEIVFALRDEGWSYRKIARQINSIQRQDWPPISHEAIRDWCRNRRGRHSSAVSLAS